MVRKKNILLTTNSSWNVVNFRSGLIKEISKSNFNFVVACPDDGYSKMIHSYNCKFVNTPIDSSGLNPFRDLITIFYYIYILRRYKIDLVLSFTIKPNIYSSIAAKILNTPSIVNITGIGSAFINKNWLERLSTSLYRFALSKTKLVFFQNQDDMELFISKNIAKQERSKIIPGSGVNIDFFEKFKTKHKEKNFFCFIMISRLIVDKGLKEFLEASRLVKEKHPEIKFQILGKKDSNISSIDEHNLNQYIEENVVEILDFTDDVRGSIHSADCVVLPSYREGLPKSLLEAMAMSKPILASDVPGCRNLVVDGENGFLFEVKNANALAQAMLKIFNLDHTKILEMGKFGKKFVTENFNEKDVISIYSREIDRILWKS